MADLQGPMEVNLRKLKDTQKMCVELPSIIYVLIL